MNILRFVEANPDVAVGVLALRMGLDLSQGGLAKAAFALRDAKRVLRTPLNKRITRIDAMTVASQQCKTNFGKIEIGMNDHGQYPDGQTQGHMMVESGLNIDGNPTKLDMFDGTIIDQRLRVATYVFDVTSNRDAILRTEARRSI